MNGVCDRNIGCNSGKLLYGACCGIDDVALVKKVGYDFFEAGVAQMLVPDKSDNDWQEMKDRILTAELPLRSCIGFLPSSFQITGPEASFNEPLDYAERACHRADEVGVKTIVFGSGGARTVPNVSGEADIRHGEEQFTAFCSELVKRISGLNVTIVIEPLRTNETNIVNFVWQGQKMVESIGSPRVRLLADFFHMLSGGEGAESILNAKDLLLHCHIAAAESRMFPGSNSTDFKPYFSALKSIGYDGGVSCECIWGEKEDFEKNLTTALATMKYFSA